MNRTDDELIEKVTAICQHIRNQPDAPPRLAELAELLEISPGHLQRTFKRVTGVSPKQYADACRVVRLKAGLKSRQTVTAAMLDAGYGSSSRLYEQVEARLGMTPRTYQIGGRALDVRFTAAPCQLGYLLLAATDRGVCAVSLGDSVNELEQWLISEFPAANILRADKELRDWLQALLEHLAGDLPHPKLPLDVRGTAFQKRVWEELRRIPSGETRTYAQIAAALGQPRAVRAVARACATNPVSILTPCHRVIGSDGKLRGYRWGMERKQQLLDQEQQCCES